MPKTKREYLKRYADQSINDLDRAIEKITQLRNEYIDGSPLTDDDKQKIRDDIANISTGPYKDYIDAWSMVLVVMIQARQFVIDMRDHHI